MQGVSINYVTWELTRNAKLRPCHKSTEPESAFSQDSQFPSDSRKWKFEQPWLQELFFLYAFSLPLRSANKYLSAVTSYITCVPNPHLKKWSCMYFPTSVLKATFWTLLYFNFTYVDSIVYYTYVAFYSFQSSFTQILLVDHIWSYKEER